MRFSVGCYAEEYTVQLKRNNEDELNSLRGGTPVILQLVWGGLGVLG